MDGGITHDVRDGHRGAGSRLMEKNDHDGR